MPIIDILANVTKKNNKKVIKRLIKGKNGHNRLKKNGIDSNSLVEDCLIRKKIRSGNYSLSGGLKETKGEKNIALGLPVWL
jgi:hypothetical protein